MKKLFLVPLTIVLVGTMIFGGCAAPAPENIVLGEPVALTGHFAGFGTGGEFGVRAAVDDINAQGGIYIKEFDRKIPVKIVVADDESDPTKAGVLAEDLIVRSKVDFMVSAIIPPPMNAPVATVCEREKIPYVMGTGPMEPWMGLRGEVTPPWSYTWAMGFSIHTPLTGFRAVPGYTIMDIGVEALNEVIDRTNRVAGVFASEDSDGVAWYKGFPGILSDAGCKVIGYEEEIGLFPMDTMDYTSMIKVWKDNDVEIVWGNCPAPHFGAMWRQMVAMDYVPKMLYAARAALFYTDVAAWGGDLPWGVGCENWWDPTYQGCPGIGNTTPVSLTERWTDETGLPVNPNIGWGYAAVQVLADAIERAGSIDPDKVNAALADTDMMTIIHRVKWDANQFSGQPIYYFQWEKTDTPSVWNYRITVSHHDFVQTTGETIFPLPQR